MTLFCLIVAPQEPSNQGDDGELASQNEVDENQAAGEDNENRQDGGDTTTPSDPNQSTDAVIANGTNQPTEKKKFGWLPIIIIVAAIAALLLLGLIVLLVRRKGRSGGYDRTATTDTPAPRP